MIASLTVLLLCQLAGEIAARASGLPVPGPVIGMAILLVLLVLSERSPLGFPKVLREGQLAMTSKGLLANLSLLFVPAGVGIVKNLSVFAAHGVALAVAIVASTLAALLATVGTFILVSRWMERGEGA